MIGRERIERSVTYWQWKLGLTDWDLAVEVVEAAQIGDDGTVGEIEWSWASRIARMRIASRASWTEVEGRIIHELLHLLIAGVVDPAVCAIETLSEPSVPLVRAMLHGDVEGVVRTIERLIDRRKH